jgi:hypothetical protein
MFYRRKLPHWHPDLTEATFLFVTWRLAGSIPRARLLHPPAGATPSAGRAFFVQDREVDKAAFGPVWLRDPRVASVVADALMYGENGRHFYQLQAWVIMPNHVHALLLPKTSLPVIMRWLKGSTARQANLILGRTGQAFWQDESFDHREPSRNVETPEPAFSRLSSSRDSSVSAARDVPVRIVYRSCERASALPRRVESRCQSPEYPSAARLLV